jgi:dTDP-4-amino-4,6-dideoxygalactose transaminase
MQAAILNAKLPHLDNYNRLRRQSADYYDQLLKDIPGITIPFRNKESDHVFHQYTIKVENGRDRLQEFLKERDIPSMIYYPVPLHMSSAYGYYGYKEGDFPVSEHASTQVLSLPMHTELDAEQIEYIAEAIKSFQTLK